MNSEEDYLKNSKSFRDSEKENIYNPKKKSEEEVIIKKRKLEFTDVPQLETSLEESLRLDSSMDEANFFEKQNLLTQPEPEHEAETRNYQPLKMTLLNGSNFDLKMFESTENRVNEK